MSQTHTHAPLILDIAGTALSDIDRRRLAHPLTGGMILFGRNWVDRAQLTALCADIKSVRSDLLILVDHEGGRVQRFRTDGFTHLPPMRAFGELWLQDGDRAFARDPRIVGLLAKSLMQGLLQAGMANCGKHFPGHGFVKADSHTEIPVDKRSLKNILSDDALPYGWLNSSLNSVMPAHVIYPKVDSRPAGFSKRWLQDILRQQLGFQGAVFSDDLSMAGARLIDGEQVSYTQAAVTALNAGCDLVLLCNQSTADSEGGGQAVDQLLDGLQQAEKAGEWHLSGASEARRRALLPVTPALDWDQLMRQAPYLQALALLP